MHVYELMRGDKVYETLLEDTPQPVTVEEIGQNHIYIGTADDDLALLRYEPKYLGWDIEHIKPIPVTEEMLKLNGFVFNVENTDLHYRSYHLGSLVVYWGKSNHLYAMMQTAGIGIYYVHELQRMLRCVGQWEVANKFRIE